MSEAPFAVHCIIYLYACLNIRVVNNGERRFPASKWGVQLHHLKDYAYV